MPRMPIAAALAALVSAATADPLPELTLDARATTVSGLSSGAYMAGQVHVAFSDSIAGAGIVAGGPYWCARGGLLDAVSACMRARGGDGPDIAPLLEKARTYAAAGAIAPLSGLAGDRVYLFSGSEDATVARPVTDAARDWYAAAGIAEAAITYVTDVPAGHAFLTEQGPNACPVTAPPFLNDCDRDQAGNILGSLYGDLAPPGKADPAHLRRFDQGRYMAAPSNHSLAEAGFAYVPQACTAGATCRLHIAFHGCRQGIEAVGDTFARRAGYNRWAEANNLVVLYPQAVATAAEGNPRGCWDWWGYDDPDHATRHGPQMAAVARMAAALGAPLAPQAALCVTHEAFNWQHWLEDRAEVCTPFGELCAAGSGDKIGFGPFASTLHESEPGVYHAEGCPAP